MKVEFAEYINDEEYESDVLFEMANLISKYTGLEYIVWVSVRSNREKHGPRIKVKIQNVFIPVTISDEPKVAVSTNLRIPEFRNLQEWIILNKDLLLEYWNCDGKMDLQELLSKIKKVN